MVHIQHEWISQKPEIKPAIWTRLRIETYPLFQPQRKHPLKGKAQFSIRKKNMCSWHQKPKIKRNKQNKSQEIPINKHSTIVCN